MSTFDAHLPPRRDRILASRHVCVLQNGVRSIERFLHFTLNLRHHVSLCDVPNGLRAFEK